MEDEIQLSVSHRASSVALRSAYAWPSSRTLPAVGRSRAPSRWSSVLLPRRLPRRSRRIPPGYPEIGAGETSIGLPSPPAVDLPKPGRLKNRPRTLRSLVPIASTGVSRAEREG